MALPLYLALTAPELSAASALPKHLAYMACHFSPYSTGLGNIPQNLPEGSMLILNDSIPPGGHDPELIGSQTAKITEQLGCSSILLDFQRPNNELISRIAEAIVSAVSCPVAVSEGYAAALTCPVFLSAPPADKPLQKHLEPWKNREIWLEAAPDGRIITVDTSGSCAKQCALCDPTLLPHRSEKLHCHYKIEITPEQVLFTLQRTEDDLKELLAEAENLGVVGAVGLYQELGAEFHCN